MQYCFVLHAPHSFEEDSLEVFQALERCAVGETSGGVDFDQLYRMRDRLYYYAENTLSINPHMQARVAVLWFRLRVSSVCVLAPAR